MDLDELPRQARAVLDAAAAADDPSAADRARIDATFGATLRAYGIAAPLAARPTGIPPDASTSGGAAAGKSAAAGYAAKLVLAIAGTGAVAAGLSQIPYGTTSRPSAPTVQVAAATISAHPAAIVAHGPSTIEATQSAGALGKSASSQGAAGEPNREAHRPGFAATPRTRISPMRVAPSSASSAVQGAGTPRTSAEDSLPAEVTLLQRANHAVRLGQYDRALRLLDAHAAHFENGILREERRGLHVLALCGLGQTASGQNERARFLRDFPRSVLADKVRSACGSSRDATRPGQP